MGRYHGRYKVRVLSLRRQNSADARVELDLSDEPVSMAIVSRAIVGGAIVSGAIVSRAELELLDQPVPCLSI